MLTHEQFCEGYEAPVPSFGRPAAVGLVKSGAGMVPKEHAHSITGRRQNRAPDALRTPGARGSLAASAGGLPFPGTGAESAGASEPGRLGTTVK